MTHNHIGTIVTQRPSECRSRITSSAQCELKTAPHQTRRAYLASWLGTAITISIASGEVATAHRVLRPIAENPIVHNTAGTMAHDTMTVLSRLLHVIKVCADNASYKKHNLKEELYQQKGDILRIWPQWKPVCN